MGISLTINDDINRVINSFLNIKIQTINRYECLKMKKKPEPFVSQFIENENINQKFLIKKKNFLKISSNSNQSNYF